MTASVTGSPRYVSASRLSFCSTRALISCGVYFLPSISGDFQLVPISRFTERMVRSTLVTAWFFADWPTRTSPFFANATTDGVGGAEVDTDRSSHGDGLSSVCTGVVLSCPEAEYPTCAGSTQLSCPP